MIQHVSVTLDFTRSNID